MGGLYIALTRGWAYTNPSHCVTLYTVTSQIHSNCVYILPVQELVHAVEAAHVVAAVIQHILQSTVVAPHLLGDIGDVGGPVIQ